MLTRRGAEQDLKRPQSPVFQSAVSSASVLRYSNIPLSRTWDNLADVPTSFADCISIWPGGWLWQARFITKAIANFRISFDSRRLADRLEERLARAKFSDGDRSFVESCIYFFLATADASGHPDCSFRGGPPGFVKVTGPSGLAFPDYDGNGMFKSIGNLAVNPHVGLLFIAMHGNPKRLRINGSARIDRDDPLLAETVGAQLIIRVKVDVIFPNCPRYIPAMTLTEPSVYVPSAGVAPVEPAWKGFDAFRDVVPPRREVRSE